jgi:uncharacterized protein DUF6950
MSRRSNWPAALTAFLREKTTQRFNWADNNCCFFAADWIQILTGIDPAADYRKEVCSALTAKRVLEQAGGIEAITEKECLARNWPEVRPLMAQRGDICITDTAEGPAIGVCFGAHVAFAGPDAITIVAVSACRRAWGID